MSTPITKVVKNDAYTAPRPPVPVAPTRPNTSMAAPRSLAAPRSSAAPLQPVSRTLKQSTAEASRTAPTAPQVKFLLPDVIQCAVSRVGPSQLFNVNRYLAMSFVFLQMGHAP